MEIKLCSKCGKNPRHNKYWCQQCLKGKNHKVYLKNKDKYKKQAYKWRLDNYERSKEIRRNSNRKLRQLALDHYGRKCACCGETIEQFLGIDHIDGNGGKHRKEIGSSHIYSWLKINKYPKGFQTLCHNCNMAKGFYGQCPHKNGL